MIDTAGSSTGQVTSETLADHAVLRSQGSSSSLSNAFEAGANPPLTPGALLGHSPATPIGQSPSGQRVLQHGQSASLGTAREIEALRNNTSSLSNQEGHSTHSGFASSSGHQNTATSSSQNQSSGSNRNNTADHPYRSFRVTLEDPCYKVLPAALKKYKINDDWRSYALFICYGNGTTERCLSLDEKPLLLFQKLKDSGQNPVFMLRHIKDVKSPIHVASQKHANRREKRAKDKEATLTSASTLTGASAPMSSTSRTMKILSEGGTVSIGDAGQTEGTGEDGQLGDKVDTPTSAGPQSQALPSPTTAPIKGYCIAIYPYMAERAVSLSPC